jgi:DGQHR domain-containing protein
MADKNLIVRALKSKQDNVDIFSFFMPGELIHEIADISRIHRADDFKLDGFQRKEIVRHVDSIIEFLDGESVLFPNAIILAFSGDVEFKQSRGKDPDGMIDASSSGTLYIPVREADDRAAWIVDGQQRALALAKAKRTGLPVPVVAFIAQDLELQRQQFILVNKAKPLPAQLINELLPEVDIRLPKDLAVRKIPSELCNMLNRDPDSPFYKMIRRASTTKEDRAVAVITDTALIDIIKRSLNNPVGALSQYKAFGSDPNDVNGMYIALIQFWLAVKETFPDAWGKPPTRSRLMHSAGIKAMGSLMDRIMIRAQYANDPKALVKKSLETIAPQCAWTSGTWPDLGLRWNDIQNVPRHVKALSEQLVKLDFEYSRRPAK